MKANAARVAAALLVLGTALLVIGVTTEHSESGSGETTSTRSAESAGSETKTIGPHVAASKEKVLGINPESTVSVGAATLASLIGAVGLWVTARRSAAMAVVLLGVAFAVFDVAEVAHQLDESRSGLAVLAGAVAAAHLGAAAAAGRAATIASH